MSEKCSIFLEKIVRSIRLWRLEKYYLENNLLLTILQIVFCIMILSPVFIKIAFVFFPGVNEINHIYTSIFMQNCNLAIGSAKAVTYSLGLIGIISLNFSFLNTTALNADQYLGDNPKRAFLLHSKILKIFISIPFRLSLMLLLLLPFLSKIIPCICIFFNKWYISDSQAVDFFSFNSISIREDGDAILSPALAVWYTSYLFCSMVMILLLCKSLKMLNYRMYGDEDFYGSKYIQKEISQEYSYRIFKGVQNNNKLSLRKTIDDLDSDILSTQADTNVEKIEDAIDLAYAVWGVNLYSEINKLRMNNVFLRVSRVKLLGEESEFRYVSYFPSRKHVDTMMYENAKQDVYTYINSKWKMKFLKEMVVDADDNQIFGKVRAFLEDALRDDVLLLYCFSEYNKQGYLFNKNEEDCIKNIFLNYKKTYAIYSSSSCENDIFEIVPDDIQGIVNKIAPNILGTL